jgi:DNA-binding SARP family transcriptional activator
MSYSLQMLGGVALTDASGEDAGVPHGKPMDLVAYLAMQQGGTERDYLARLLWSSGDASKGRHSVRSAAPWVRRL